MSEWQEKEIRDLAFSYAGGTPSRAKSEYFGGTIPWISSSEVNQSSITEATEKITEKGLKYSSAKWVPVDSVLIAMYGATAGQVAYLKIRATTNQAVLALIPRESGIDSRFLYYEVDFNRDKILYHAQGSGQPNLNKQIVDRTRLLVPILPVQRKIARILSTIDGQIEKTEAIIAKYQAVKQGMLQDLFTRGIDVRTGQLRPRYEDAPELYQESELGMIPKEWAVKPLRDVADHVDYRGKTPPKSGSGIFLVTAKNVKDGYIDYDISKEYIPEDMFAAVMSRGTAEVGDVLITTEAPMGNVAQVDKPYIALAQRVIKYRGKVDTIKNGFLRLVLMSRAFQDALIADSSGSTVTGIKGSRLHKMKIIVPDITEQNHIQLVAKSQERRIECEHRTLSKLQLLKQGLMQDLLSGKVEVTA